MPIDGYPNHVHRWLSTPPVAGFSRLCPQARNGLSTFIKVHQRARSMASKQGIKQRVNAAAALEAVRDQAETVQGAPSSGSIWLDYAVLCAVIPPKRRFELPCASRVSRTHFARSVYAISNANAPREPVGNIGARSTSRSKYGCALGEGVTSSQPRTMT